MKVCRGSSDESVSLRRGPVATLGASREHSGQCCCQEWEPRVTPGFSKEGEFPHHHPPLPTPSLFPASQLLDFLSLFSSVQFSRSVVSDSLWPHESQHARPPCPSPTLRLMPIESVMPLSHLILCRPLRLLPPIPPSIRVFSNESTLLMRWPKYWSFSFSISPSNEHRGLISFRMDWLDLLEGCCYFRGGQNFEDIGP